MKIYILCVYELRDCSLQVIRNPQIVCTTGNMLNINRLACYSKECPPPGLVSAKSYDTTLYIYKVMIYSKDNCQLVTFFQLFGCSGVDWNKDMYSFNVFY